MKTKFQFYLVLLIFILCITLNITKVFAQSPQSISYQALIRGINSELLTNHTIGIRFSILEGSSDGSVVYSETQISETNENGVLNLEIGNGNVVSGLFSQIAWQNNIHFLKTEIDINGGNNYTTTTTSQFLSVPYALHANSAEQIKQPRYIGELYGGGIIFWLDKTGEHGLILSLTDLGYTNKWSNATNILLGTGETDGKHNTELIINQNGHIESAAKTCYDYVNLDYGSGIYEDWYLPSYFELFLLHKNFFEIQQVLTTISSNSIKPLAMSTYFSSTEIWEVSIFCFDFSSFNFLGVGKKDGEVPNYGIFYSYIRAIRKF